MATTLYRQDSEVANELKLALEEACLELGVSLSTAFSPSAWWLLDAAQEEPSLADLAGWLSITRRRSYRPSPLNKYRKYAIDDGGDLQDHEGDAEEDNVEVIPLGDESEAEAPQELKLKERLSNAVELDVLAQDFNWNNLLSVHRTEHAQSEDDENSDVRDSIGSVEVTVNSGGVVYFALFRKSSVESEDHGSQENDSRIESAAVFKFGSSRLATQSERLGIEIARHLGVATPQARAIHSNSAEWKQVQDSVQAIKETAEAEDNEIGLQTSEELLEALRLSRCMLIMGYIRGKPLTESKQAFSPEKVALKTVTALGRTFVLDMVLRNEDRLVCHTLGWRGNPGNLLVTEDSPHGIDKLGPPAQDLNLPESLRQRRTQSFTALSLSAGTETFAKVRRVPSPELSRVGTAEPLSLQNLLIQEDSETVLIKKEGEVEQSNCLLVAIDSGVSRRPPGMKVENDRRMYSKTIELLLHDEEMAANLLREISFGFTGPPFENESTEKAAINHQKVTQAFQEGIVGAIRDMQILRMFLVKLYRTLDHVLREFMAYVSSQSDVSKKQEPSPVKDTLITETSVADDTENPKLSGSSTSELQETCAESTPNQVKSPRFPPLKVSPGSLRKSPGLSPRLATLKDSPSSLRKSPGLSPRLATLKDSPSSLGKSPGSSPRLNSPNRISPSRENWHGKGSPGRMTIKLKDVSKTAKIDSELSKKLEWWDEKLRGEGQKLCREHHFTTGFLEGGGTHSVVDSYELKVGAYFGADDYDFKWSRYRETILCDFPYLFIGSALAARSVHTLQHLGVTHILCLCPSDLEVAHVGDFPDLFTYKSIAVKDVENEDIAAHFEDACSFIETAEKEGKPILVHCFEGKSRSATVVLAYLMLRKNYTLAQAWSILKAAHRRTQPNDGFMKTLMELDIKLHGKASMSFSKRRPVGQKCPICDKLAGLSLTAVHQHIRRMHPAVSPPSPPTVHKPS